MSALVCHLNSELLTQQRGETSAANASEMTAILSAVETCLAAAFLEQSKISQSASQSVSQGRKEVVGDKLVKSESETCIPDQRYGIM